MDDCTDELKEIIAKAELAKAAKIAKTLDHIDKELQRIKLAIKDIEIVELKNKIKILERQLERSKKWWR